MGVLSLPQRGRWRGAVGSVTDEEVAIKIYFTGVVWILFVAQGFFCIDTRITKDVKPL